MSIIEMLKKSSEVHRLVGRSIGMLEFLIEWFENPKERILEQKSVVKLCKELLVELNK